MSRMGPMGKVYQGTQKMLGSRVGRTVASGVASTAMGPLGGAATKLAAQGAQQMSDAQKRVAQAKKQPPGAVQGESLRERMEGLLDLLEAGARQPGGSTVTRSVTRYGGEAGERGRKYARFKSGAKKRVKRVTRRALKQQLQQGQELEQPKTGKLTKLDVS